MLSAIYIKGFKTFARPTRMPLTGGITAIVGPNGSGKSNITDAVLFALGEGSPGLLRAGAMGGLIFSGSDSLPAANAAEVTLVLDNAGGHISLPYREVSLTRRISRGGEGEYRINGARARLADVRAVAGEAGLGRHSILRQGSVDAIVAGGAAACRTALEEAAGLMVFRRRRQAASRRLEKAAEGLESSRQLEAELSAQLGRIEAEAAAAREYRQLETRYRQLSLAYLYRVAAKDLDEKRKLLADLEERETALAARQGALHEEERRLGAEEKDLEGKVSAAERALVGLEKGSEALRAGSLRAERALLRLEGIRDSGAGRSRSVRRLETELEEIDARIRRLEEEVDGLEEEHARRKEASLRLEELAARGRAERAEAERRAARLAGRLEALGDRRERVAGRLKEGYVLGDEGLGRLERAKEEPVLRAAGELRARLGATLGRFEELRSVAVGRISEADRRGGALGALIGRTEAEIRVLRASGQSSSGDGERSSVRRLYEVLRPRPGYEAAVEAALGEMAAGVLAETLDEGLKLLRDAPTERVIVRLDAQAAPEHGGPPGEPILRCVEVLDASYAGFVERLLGGVYVLPDGQNPAAPGNGHVAVTREGLRLTRTSASRHVVGGDDHFAREARLAEEEERLDALKHRIGGELYDLRETVSSLSRRVDERLADLEDLGGQASRTARAARLLAAGAARRARGARTARERRLADEAELRGVAAELSVVEDELREAREAGEKAGEGLDAALPDAEAAYDGAREAAGRLYKTRADLRAERERRVRVAKGLERLAKGAATADANERLAALARRSASCARRLEEVVRGRLGSLRRARSEAAGLRDKAVAGRLGLAGEAGSLAEDLAGVRARADALQAGISREEEAKGAAEAEIRDEWGADAEIARSSAGELSHVHEHELERERARLARRIKTFGDVNLLAIGQEGALRERHGFVAAQRADAEAAAAEIEQIIRDIDGEIESRFAATYGEVRRAFSSIVPRMMEGAKGELSLSEEGVEIGLRLKGRGWRPLRVLSGGERSLLALSFLFAIFLGRSFAGSFSGTAKDACPANPAAGAFCVLDEAEAALDDLNLARFLAVVDSYRADGQFLLVTHQKRTMAAADVLYGVTPDASGATVVVSKRLTGE